MTDTASTVSADLDLDTPAKRRILLKGEEAIVLAAAVAGADLYGYPITPVTGVVELASRVFNRVGRIFLQAESELAAANMAYGASAVGQRVLCVSSSPGVSLKQEAISYMCGAELPGVFVNAMRGGPGLGNIGASQADYFQATRGGGHGDYYTPVFAPASVGETFDMTLEAFNVADRYRTPVMVVIDGSIAQSTASVELGAEAAELARHFDKPWAATGAVGRDKNVVTSFRLEPLAALENLNIHLQEKYDRIERELGGLSAAAMLDDAELLVVAYGSMAGLALAAVTRARKKGLKVGLVRPQTLWPFPSAVIREAAWRTKGVLVLEMSAGQMLQDVQLAIGEARDIFFYGRMGGIVPAEDEILEQIEQAYRTMQEKSRDPDFNARTRLLEREHTIRRLPRPTGYAEPPAIERRYRRPQTDQQVVVDRAASIEDVPTHYCPGCGHGNLHQLIARAIDEQNLRERTVLVEPVGCSVVTYWNFDTVQAAHGRGMALATAISRSLDDRIVISYQGDGDLASIGMAETIHAASRGEDFVLVFVNNCIYGMTGGQMAPTSLPGLATTTCDTGRDVADVGVPIDMCKLFGQLDGVVYLERVAIDGPGGMNKVSKALGKALKYQADGVGGLKVVEVLSPCPVGWKMTPADAQAYIREVVEKHFRPGLYKDVGEAIRPRRVHPPAVEPGAVLDNLDLHIVPAGTGYERPDRSRFPRPGLRLAGHGGQGIVLLSGLLVHAAVRSGERISLLPSYGSAMRGGTCNCQVRISDTTIASPYVDSPDVLLAMNQPSYDTFAPTVRNGGLLIYDSSLVPDADIARVGAGVEVIAAPLTKIAADAGGERMANIVAAGVLVGAAGLLDPRAVRDSIPEIFAAKPKLAEPNLAAFEAGLEFAAGI